MASHDEDRFRVRPKPPKSRGGPRSQRFVSQVLRQVSEAGANAAGGRYARPASTFGRGRVAAGMVGSTLNPRARRVVIKSRFVVLKKAGANAVPTHLRYIVREGVTRDGEPGQAYGPDVDTADLKAFEDRGRGDRHQFRFIVSVEDAEQLEELRSYTRALLQQMSTDLETPLDWIAVDHWDTDNPHTHVVLRGRAADGRDLVIAPDYMAHGMRRRAIELATEWLGPRTELEIRQGLLREVDQERLTSLDRTLLRRSKVRGINLAEPAGDPHYGVLLRGRLQRLETMGLAWRLDTHCWQLSARLESTLTALGERGDILRTMQRALHGQSREFVLPHAGREEPVVGRIAAKGVVDELNDRAYLVVDGVDGRAHYFPLNAGTDLAEFPLGGIVEARVSSAMRRSDRTIASVARDGVYRVEDHLQSLRGKPEGGRDHAEFVAAHVRRLEALRRAGMVERIAEGVWRIPADLPEQGHAYDARRLGEAQIVVHSHLPIAQQTRAIGATWLDRQLVQGTTSALGTGFGDEVRAALRQRAEFLLSEGLAERAGTRFVFARNLLGTLRDRDIERAANTIARETGLTHHMLAEGDSVTGIYRRSVLLASGRFAMLDDGGGFSLVPWRPVIERRLGQSLTATVQGSGASWSVGRQRGSSMV